MSPLSCELPGSLMDSGAIQALCAAPVDVVAQRLLGCVLVVGDLAGRISETEAYDHLDPASHTYRGLTSRNRSMFGPVGHWYVYLSYGIHWCANVVAGVQPGAAVLLRSIEPIVGREQMQRRRGGALPIATGPGRLTQALGIDHRHDGCPLWQAPFGLIDRPEPPAAIEASPRIGITKNAGALRRYQLGNPSPNAP